VRVRKRGRRGGGMIVVAGGGIPISSLARAWLRAREKQRRPHLALKRAAIRSRSSRSRDSPAKSRSTHARINSFSGGHPSDNANANHARMRPQARACACVPSPPSAIRHQSWWAIGESRR
jgi:hypothetical protein